jgi:hypothetical protein
MKNETEGDSCAERLHMACFVAMAAIPAPWCNPAPLRDYPGGLAFSVVGQRAPDIGRRHHSTREMVGGGIFSMN